MMNDQVVDRLRTAWREDPASLAFVPLAEALRRRGDLEEAIQISKAGLDKRPNHSSGHLVLGRCFFDKVDLSEAIREFEEVVSLDSKNALALRLLGLALKGKGWGSEPEPAEPKPLLARASSRGGGDLAGDIEFVTRTMAEILEKQGYLQKALEVYEHLATNHPERPEIREKIDAIREALERSGTEGGEPS